MKRDNGFGRSRSRSRHSGHVSDERVFHFRGQFPVEMMECRPHIRTEHHGTEDVHLDRINDRIGVLIFWLWFWRYTLTVNIYMEEERESYR